MKLIITDGTQGGTPMRHLDPGTEVDMTVEDATALLQAGRARLAHPEVDQAEVTAYAKKVDIAAQYKASRGGHR